MSEHRNSETDIKGRAKSRHLANVAYREDKGAIKSYHALGVLDKDSKPIEPLKTPIPDRLNEPKPDPNGDINLNDLELHHLEKYKKEILKDFKKKK